MIRLILAVLSLGLAAGAAQAQSPEENLRNIQRMLTSAGVPPASEERIAELALIAAAHPLGSTANPVRATMPQGQRAYLQRLRCANGRAPSVERVGSVGESPYGNIMDHYAVDCRRSAPGRVDVYMDMYHFHVEEAPAPGFTIVPPR